MKHDLLHLEDKEKELVLTAEVPGFMKEEIETLVGEDSVEIRGTMKSSQDEKARGYIQKERTAESFHPKIRLPEKIKTRAAEASLKDGVFEIIASKKAPRSKKKISIK